MSVETTIPDDVRGFLRDHVRSFEELETLLLLRRARETSWTAASLGDSLKLSGTLVEQALEHLCAEGLCAQRPGPAGPTYHAEASDAALDALAERLARAYAEQRIEVMKLMTANAVERLRGSALRTFADAFLVGRKRDG